MKLPEAFEKRMKAMLGSDYDSFVKAYDRVNTPALRLNPLKKAKEDLHCIGNNVPWAENGYYYDPDSDIRPGKHPYHEAGAYYIQEASAMIPASLFPPKPSEKVLDLCAAPGGKTTQLASALMGEGLLVANEIHPQRAAVLSQNVERMGIKNAVVTNHAPHELVPFFPSFFDKIVVDAPCSGEGMFRKEEQALTMWSQENVDLCASRQKDILESAAKMLAPNGYLTYSTCTFAPEENEGVILDFLKGHPEFEVAEVKNPIVLKCIETGLIDRGNPDWVADSDEYAEQIRKTVRLFPHHADGEGHFAALLHKREESTNTAPIWDNKSRKKDRNKEQVRQQLTVEKAYKAFKTFISGITDEELDGVPCLFGEHLYLCPRELKAEINGLRIIRNGLHLGSIVNCDRFEPSHSLALALDVSKLKKAFATDYSGAISYLGGNVLQCENEKGWYVITLDNLPLGWCKASSGMMKNHCPKGLRKNF